MNKICPQCKTKYSDPELVKCPEDGLELMPEDDPLMGRTIAGRFTISDYLGAGGMGTVYRATQAHIDREVALKVLKKELAANDETVERFRREAKAASLLKNPHTVTLFDFGIEEDGLLFLAMEFLEGETLTEHLYKIGRFEWPEALSVARQVTESLREAHEQGIVHRDLKPDNVFLDEEVGGKVWVKVLDFGIARLAVGAEGQGPTLTQAGMVFGTPGYMAPEQAQGKRVDSRADLYSLGVVLYEMLVGAPLYEAESVVLLMAKHITAPVPTISERSEDVEVPTEVEALVGRLLAKEADDRCQSAQEVIELIDRVLGGEGLPEISRAIPPTARSPRPKLDSGDIGWASTTPLPEQGAAPPSITSECIELAHTTPAGGRVQQTVDPMEGTRKPGSRRSLALAAVVVIAVLAGIGVVAAFTLLGAEEDPEDRIEAASNDPSDEALAPADEPTVETPPPEPEPVEIEIRAEPASAEIWLDGQQLEGNPYKAQRIPSEDRHLLVVKAAGYVTREREVTFDQGRSLEIVLREEETPAAAQESDSPRRGDRPSRPTKTKRPSSAVPIYTELP